MRLIDADYVKQRIDETMSSDYVYSTRSIKKLIDEAPTINAEPVRHGKWIISDIEEEEEKLDTAFARLYECSVCGAGYVYRMSEDIAEEKYCYNCGAKMEGAEE